MPVFVLTHHARGGLEEARRDIVQFVTDGIEAALAQARAAAGDKDVVVAGGADLAQQYLRAGDLDDIHIHLAPVLLGDGVRLFDDLAGEQVELEVTSVIHSPAVTHLRYRVVR